MTTDKIKTCLLDASSWIALQAKKSVKKQNQSGKISKEANTRNKEL